MYSSSADELVVAIWSRCVVAGESCCCSSLELLLLLGESAPPLGEVTAVEDDKPATAAGAAGDEEEEVAVVVVYHDNLERAFLFRTMDHLYPFLVHCCVEFKMIVQGVLVPWTTGPSQWIIIDGFKQLNFANSLQF